MDARAHGPQTCPRTASRACRCQASLQVKEEELVQEEAEPPEGAELRQAAGLCRGRLSGMSEAHRIGPEVQLLQQDDQQHGPLVELEPLSWSLRAELPAEVAAELAVATHGTDAQRAGLRPQRSCAAGLQHHGDALEPPSPSALAKTRRGPSAQGYGHAAGASC